MKIGFIGAGNMGQALIGGILKQGNIKPEDIMAADVAEQTRTAVSEQFGVQTTQDNLAVVSQADILFLAVKPIFLPEVAGQIRDALSESQTIISIVAGKSLSWLEEALGKEKQIIRTMPNTPALVGEGITAVCPNANVSKETLDLACTLLEGCGMTQVVPERLMDAVVAVSGSSPAYVFMFIEAMADAAVAEGMPRDQAYVFAAQSVLGSAKMVLETGKHPGQLKDMVCSPAGTTIDAVKVLEQKGMRSAVMEAMAVCAEKNRNL